MAESEETLNLFDGGERVKTGFKLNIQTTEIIASSPIISWQIDGEKMETVMDIFLGSKTLDSDCRPEIKGLLFLRRKAVTNPDRVCWQRSILSRLWFFQ